MGVVVARADIVKALRTYLKTFPELTALINPGAPRVSAELQDSWPMPTRAVLLRKAGGPPPDISTGRKSTRIDTFSYGSTGLEAHNVWAMLDAILVPAPGGYPTAQWRAEGCRVDEVVPEADALAGVETDSGWPRVFAPYIVYWWSL